MNVAHTLHSMHRAASIDGLQGALSLPCVLLGLSCLYCSTNSEKHIPSDARIISKQLLGVFLTSKIPKSCSFGLNSPLILQYIEESTLYRVGCAISKHQNNQQRQHSTAQHATLYCIFVMPEFTGGMKNR